MLQAARSGAGCPILSPSGLVHQHTYQFDLIAVRGLMKEWESALLLSCLQSWLTFIPYSSSVLPRQGVVPTLYVLQPMRGRVSSPTLETLGPSLATTTGGKGQGWGWGGGHLSHTHPTTW